MVWRLCIGGRSCPHIRTRHRAAPHSGYGDTPSLPIATNASNPTIAYLTPDPTRAPEPLYSPLLRGLEEARVAPRSMRAYLTDSDDDVTVSCGIRHAKRGRLSPAGGKERETCAD
jgi:hypothetical protein